MVDRSFEESSVSSKLRRKILLLEINEIPWRVIDKFKNDNRFTNINLFFSKSKNFTTIVTDINQNPPTEKLVHGLSRDNVPVVINSDELSPWVTWPAFHRGMSSKNHKIKFLGQDVSTFQGKPIWQEFLERGHSIGLCGSLQSWPPLNPGDGGFYIPDTFAHNEKCIPEYVEPFQKFNLDQVQKNGLVIREKGSFSPELFGLLTSLPKLGLTANTVLKIVSQIALEVFNKKHIARRPVFQCVLFWDIFKKLYNVNNPPAFSTFFTNHFASLIHRYWCDIFPEDFDGDINTKNKLSHYEIVMYGLKIIDEMLGEVIQFCGINPDIAVVFASSMGQDAIKYTAFEGYSAELENIDKLFSWFNIKKNEYKPQLAMVPQFAIEVLNPKVKEKIVNSVNGCFTVSGNKLFTVEEAGNTLSITIHTPPLCDIEAGEFMYKADDKTRQNISWQESGIIMHKLDAATGYHVPEGIMAFYGRDIKPDDSRKNIELSNCKTILLDLAFERCDEETKCLQ